MPDPIFRPGDRVRCVEPGPTSLVEDEVYVVDWAFATMVAVKGNGNVYAATRFRKVEEVKP